MNSRELAEFGGDTIIDRLRLLIEEFAHDRPQCTLPEGMTMHLKTDHLAVAKAAYDERRQRDRLLQRPDLFGEPAWDMLLDIFIHHKARRQLSVQSACIGSSGPPTTALRYLKALQSAGWIERMPDAQDGRRVFVVMTEKAIARMEAWCDTVNSTRPTQMMRLELKQSPHSVPNLTQGTRMT